MLYQNRKMLCSKFLCRVLPLLFLEVAMNTSTLKVTKRDGRLEPINLDKIHRVVEWAAENLQNVSVSQVELKSHIQFYDGICTKDIHETIIKSAADLISEETPDYQYLAARLAIFHLRKVAYGEYTPPHLFEHVKKMVEMGDVFICKISTDYAYGLCETFLRCDFHIQNFLADPNHVWRSHANASIQFVCID